jgi:hypothetical protein
MLQLGLTRLQRLRDMMERLGCLLVHTTHIMTGNGDMKRMGILAYGC